MRLALSKPHARSTRSWRAVFGVVAVLAFGACSDAATAPTAKVQWDLLSNRARWRAQHLDDYTFEYSRYCFCGMDVTSVLVVVRDGVVVAATNPDDSPVRYSLSLLPTVNDLFDAIDRAARSNPDFIEVTYDASRGYPTSISVDYKYQVADDEIGQVARQLRPL
jgi:hypothetical protein